MWFTFIGSWFTCLVQCYCLTVYHDLQLPGRLEIILRIRTGPTGRFSYPGSHTSEGESGAGFGRLGQAVSGKCEGWSRGAGLRTVIESLYGVAMRRRLKTIDAGWLAR